MPKNLKKIFLMFAILLFCITVFYQPTKTFALEGYTSLAPITASGEQDRNLVNCEKSKCLSTYLQNLFLISIGLAGAMAVFMIVLGGIQYMSTDAVGKKEQGKIRIQNALEGLALVLLCWLIMYTINPKLVGLDFNPGGTTNSSNTTGIKSIDTNQYYTPLNKNGNTYNLISNANDPNPSPNQDFYYYTGSHIPTTKTYNTLDECQTTRERDISNVTTNYYSNVSNCISIGQTKYNLIVTNTNTNKITNLPHSFNTQSECDQEIASRGATPLPSNFRMSCQIVNNGYSYTTTISAYEDNHNVYTKQECDNIVSKINNDGGNVRCLKKVF